LRNAIRGLFDRRLTGLARASWSVRFLIERSQGKGHAEADQLRGVFMTSASVAARRGRILTAISGSLVRKARAVRHFFGVICNKGDRAIHHGQLFLALTEGRSFEETYRMFGETAEGRRLLETRPDVAGLLRDRAALRDCPPGSFGRTYFEVMTLNAFDEEVYAVGARRLAKAFGLDERRAWLRHRVELGHDVRHVLTGYGPEVLGEGCLLVFRWAQLDHIGAFVLANLAVIGAKLREGGSISGPLREAYERGRAARRVDLLPWEFGLATALSDHRAALDLSAPIRYQAWLDERSKRQGAISTPRDIAPDHPRTISSP
jgi:ubiquinone biosynthesis protein COQ4